MRVTERFTLDETFKKKLYSSRPHFGFNGFGEVIYYRTYSRKKADGSQERWADTVIRVVEGILSIRKNHYKEQGLAWDDGRWKPFAERMAESCFSMHWLPPGRGLWIMGTDYIYERGSAALYNCGAVDTSDLVDSADWAMDMLMSGVGVGFNTAWSGDASIPDKSVPKCYVIEDSKEGWVKSVRLILESYCRSGPFYRFDYSHIRPAGSPIHGFGGTASGPEPLKALHRRLETIMDRYCRHEIDKTRCVADVFNAIGVCVVAGNVRRSAEIALGSPHDETFLHLKDYERFPDRKEIGWMSNNSVLLETHEDFEKLPEIAELIRHNGEPGILNLVNVQKYGRFGKEIPDRAWLTNPCGEIALESFELCNLAEIFPTRCRNEEDFKAAVEFATFYAVTVSLLPTHRSETNAVIARNRRTGVSISGITDWIEKIGVTRMTRILRDTYKAVRRTNERLAKASGIPVSLKVTAIKPSGTISLLAGVSPGMHYPVSRYAIRRLRIGNRSKITQFLKEAGVPNMPDLYSRNTTVFEFPIRYDNSRSVEDVSAWEQFSLLAMLQREWSDNMVSCTISFDEEIEGEQIEHMLAMFAPVIKSASMLPRKEKEPYMQMPIEPISQDEYEKRVKEMPKIDWSAFEGSDGAGEGYCSILACNV
ncbi:glycyl radical enzyme family protein [Hydrogenimonas cancrithermarum]|uniref:ribonucleoside-triphosphate reductase (thioredoxin) n=1 Tax=Hydrogenimonas cancrithermarum TaxID=2993563 RepID=A0ABM8FHU7_9BACT|nr:fused protease/ribonucleoside-triphosphate reductase [Hydrogenimonas cancrithermarum]BDY11862.1 adenosylcobalamin-dependent ribonucleoside-triphosphate reductase [Hydrogenimonas cancrithermarum]